jgi:hypothetical protein
MALQQRGEHWYGSGPDDIHRILDMEAEALGGTVSHHAEAVCECGGRAFWVVVVEGRACVTLDCEGCQKQLHAGPRAVTIEVAGAEVCNCPCGGDCFEVCAGIGVLPGRRPRRFFLGCRCTLCGLVGEYGDYPMPPRARRPIWRVAR